MKDKFKGALGLCMRARKCVMGTQAAVGSIKKQKAKLVLLSDDAAQGTHDEITTLCSKFGVQLKIGALKDIYYDLTGKQNLKVIAVEDDSFADMMKKIGYL